MKGAEGAMGRDAGRDTTAAIAGTAGEAEEAERAEEAEKAEAAQEVGEEGGQAGEAAQGDAHGGAETAEELLYDVIRRLRPLQRTIVRAAERTLDGTGLTAGERTLLDALARHGPRTVPQLARSSTWTASRCSAG
ncbi:hypothetical protein O1L55_21310 [Streptomyces albulus]|nr:hypothetical protein [Streptomyces noursei]